MLGWGRPPALSAGRLAPSDFSDRITPRPGRMPRCRQSWWSGPSLRVRTEPGRRAGAVAIRAERSRPRAERPRPAAYVDGVADDPATAAIDGVFGSQDRTRHMAVRVADRWVFRVRPPESFMRCHDKLEARRWQQRIVPEATPRFALLDLDDADADPPMPFPFFMKPTTGHLSQARLHDPRPGRAPRRMGPRPSRTGRCHVVRPAPGEGASSTACSAEELLTGRQVTFEGFMHQGEPDPVGVTDSVLHPTASASCGSTTRAPSRPSCSGGWPGSRSSSCVASSSGLAVQHGVLRGAGG
jgi:hypothetical protein